MVEGTTFKRLIPETGPALENAEKVKRLIFCSGKVYYDLTKERARKDLDSSIAIARVEQVRGWLIYLPFFQFSFIQNQSN